MALPSYSVFDRIKSIQTHWSGAEKTLVWASDAYINGKFPSANPVQNIWYSISPSLNAAQRDVAQHAFSLWSDLIQSPIIFGSDPVFGRPDITLGWGPLQSGVAGVSNNNSYAFKFSLPFSYASTEAHRLTSAAITISDTATVNIHAKDLYYKDIIGTSSGYLSYALTTQIHEIGHAIGLSHTGAYNAGSVAATGPTYLEDTDRYTVMSYYTSNADWQGHRPQTPMLDDVFAIQQKYGASANTRNTATVYGFNSNAGDTVFDFKVNRFPVLTIYDAGGTDTLDLSGYKMSNIVNLNINSYSSVAGLKDNLALASTIERLICGAGGDTVYCNTTTGSTVIAGGGNDTISGGSASDTIVFKTMSGRDTLQNLSLSINGNAAGNQSSLVYDHIKFSKSIFSDYSSVFASAADDGAGNLDISKNGSVVKILGYTKSKINSEWFIFGEDEAPGGPSTPIYTTQSTSTDRPFQTENIPLFGAMVYNADSVSGKVVALYDAILGRGTDVLGLENHSVALKNGVQLRDLASGFLGTPEGQARAGALDNTSFVKQLYQATLHRDADAGGLNTWVNELARGATRADIAVSFALSTEHLVNMQEVYGSGIFVPDADTANVARLYYAVLNRAPDASGLSAWTGLVKQGTSLNKVTESFLSAPEVQAKTANLTNAQYVDMIYQNALGRHAEVGGLATWTAELGQGASRVGVTTAIGLSTEAQQYHLAQIEQGWLLS